MPGVAVVSFISMSSTRPEGRHVNRGEMKTYNSKLLRLFIILITPHLASTGGFQLLIRPTPLRLPKYRSYRAVVGLSRECQKN